MSEEALQEIQNEQVDPDLSSSESEEAVSLEQEAAEPPSKYLGFFDDETQAQEAVRQMAEKLSYYEQNNKVQDVLNAERLAMEKARIDAERNAAAEQEAYAEHAAVHQLANYYLDRGMGPQAIKVLSDHAARQALGQVDKIVEEKLQGVVGPAYEKKQYLESSIGKEFPHLADQAIKLLQTGMSRGEIVDLFRSASTKSNVENIQNARKNKAQALRDGYMEPPDGGSTQPSVPEGDFMKKNKSAFEEWFGKRPKK